MESSIPPTLSNRILIGRSKPLKRSSAICIKRSVKLVDPFYTSSTCPRCGSRLESRNGWVECPNCGLKADRQFIGAYNIWMRGSGATLSGDKANKSQGPRERES
ncbi:MAG TPA: hypothetical protein ENF25_01380 [Thermoprotei archaeon]|nr:hypothetical protein [Thermoprotei archaeon]